MCYKLYGFAELAAIASATRTASRTASTLWTRTMLAPCETHKAAAAALALSLSFASLCPAATMLHIIGMAMHQEKRVLTCSKTAFQCIPVILPRKPFRDGPTSSGALWKGPFNCPLTLSSPPTSWQFPSAVLANPMPAKISSLWNLPKISANVHAKCPGRLFSSASIYTLTAEPPHARSET